VCWQRAGNLLSKYDFLFIFFLLLYMATLGLLSQNILCRICTAFFLVAKCQNLVPKGQLGCMDCSHFQDSCYYLATSFKIWRISLIGLQKVAKKPQEHHSFIYLFIYLFMFGFDFLKEI